MSVGVLETASRAEQSDLSPLKYTDEKIEAVVERTYGLFFDNAVANSNPKFVSAICAWTHTERDRRGVNNPDSPVAVSDIARELASELQEDDESAALVVIANQYAEFWKLKEEADLQLNQNGTRDCSRLQMMASLLRSECNRHL